MDRIARSASRVDPPVDRLGQPLRPPPRVVWTAGWRLAAPAVHPAGALSVRHPEDRR